MSCSSVNRSTIFPLASSPHCRPTTEVADTKLPRLFSNGRPKGNGPPVFRLVTAGEKTWRFGSEPVSDQEHASLGRPRTQLVYIIYRPSGSRGRVIAGRPLTLRARKNGPDNRRNKPFQPDFLRASAPGRRIESRKKHCETSDRRLPPPLRIPKSGRLECERCRPSRSACW